MKILTLGITVLLLLISLIGCDRNSGEVIPTSTPVADLHEVLEIIEKPQSVIPVSSELEPNEEPIVFLHNNKQYTFMFYYESIGIWGDPDIAPELKLYLRLFDDSSDNFYFIGEYICGVPMLAPNYRYDVNKEAFTTCLLWYGGGGTAVFLALENNELFVYEVLADVPLEEAEPQVIAVIKLNS